MAEGPMELTVEPPAREVPGTAGAPKVPSDPGALQRLADELAGVGDWGSAAEHVNLQLLEIDPERAIAMTRLARCLRDRGDTQGAEVVYGRLLALDPANVIASNYMRRLRLQQERALADGREAAAARKRAVTRRPLARSVSGSEPSPSSELPSRPRKPRASMSKTTP